MGLKTFRNQKLRNKLLIIYILGFFIPMMFINILFSYNLYLEDRDFDRKNLENQISKASILIKNEFNSALQIIYSVYINKDLTDFIRGSYSSSNEYLKERNQVFKTNSLLNQLSTYDIKYTIFTKNKKYRPDPVIKRIDKEVETSLWYREFTKSKKTGYLYYTNENREYISIIRTLDYRVKDDKKWDNILKADIPINKIIEHINGLPREFGVSLLSNKNEVVYQTINNKSIDYVFEKNFVGIKMLSEWSLRGLMYKKSYYTYLVSNNRIKIIIPIIIILVSGSLIIFMLSRSFYSRIYRLSRRMEDVRLGNFKPVEIFLEDGDEITELSRSYNIMIDHIENLINEVSEGKIRENSNELAKNKAQLSALISQINPHYLFNVLESIRMKSLVKGEKETANIIKHLSRSFRHTISWDKNIITLKEELDIVNDFLKVQKYRFGDKLNYTINVDESLYVLNIPRLSLQPFIENSCIHGIENIDNDGILNITIFRDNDFLRVTIKDNGQGITDEVLTKLHTEMSNCKVENRHIGFSNTYWRLKKLYSNFSLQIESTLSQGTTIYLNIPVTEGDNVDL